MIRIKCKARFDRTAVIMVYMVRVIQEKRWFKCSYNIPSMYNTSNYYNSIRYRVRVYTYICMYNTKYVYYLVCKAFCKNTRIQEARERCITYAYEYNMYTEYLY